MLKLASNYIKNPTTLRRLLFAASHLPVDLPDYWKAIVSFGKDSSITVDEAKMLVENMQDVDPDSFVSDFDLLEELNHLSIPKCKPFGLVLISTKKKCIMCGTRLLLRKDRPAPVTVYDHSMGSIQGTHFHKYCANRGCNLIQHYGYYTTATLTSSTSHVYFDDDWLDLPYFVSSRESVFSMDLLHTVNAQILIGQMSFIQCAEMYNFLHKSVVHEQQFRQGECSLQ